MIRRFIAWLRGSPVKHEPRPWSNREALSIGAHLLACERRNGTWGQP